MNQLREATQFVYKNEIVFVASRGNDGKDQGQGLQRHTYPAVIDPEWVIAVGGTGSDGQYWDNVNDNFPTTAEGYRSKGTRGSEIDVSAPASELLITTLAPIYLANQYVSSGGTSSANAIVSGATALMTSYYNKPYYDYNNLAPEDYEHIMERTATDCNSSNFPGHDSLTGYGRINAGLALQQIDTNNFHLIHLGTNNTSHTQYSNLISSGEIITLTEPYQGNISYAAQQYKVNKYKVEQQFNLFLPFGDELIDAWGRGSSSNLFGDVANGKLQPRERVLFDMNSLSSGNNNAYPKGYVYEVFDLQGNPLGWIPFNPAVQAVNLEITLLMEDEFSTADIKELSQGATINVYPNPANKLQFFEINLERETNVNVNLLDLNGRTVLPIFTGNIVGNKKFEIATSNLVPGLYVYKIVVGDKIYHKKVFIEGKQ